MVNACSHFLNEKEVTDNITSDLCKPFNYYCNSKPDSINLIITINHNYDFNHLQIIYFFLILGSNVQFKYEHLVSQ